MLTIIYGAAFTCPLRDARQGAESEAMLSAEMPPPPAAPPGPAVLRYFPYISEYYSARRPVSRVLSGALPPVDSHSSGTPVAGRLARPTRESGAGRRLDRLPGPILLSGLAPGGVCRAGTVAGPAVRSYRTVSPLPRGPKAPAGGLFSVALSLRSLSPGVTRHRLPVEPGLSSTAAIKPRRQRPSSRLARGLARSAGLSCQSGALCQSIRPGSPSFPGRARCAGWRGGNAGRRRSSRPWRWPRGRHWPAGWPGR